MDRTLRRPRQILLPAEHEIAPRDIELFERHLASFVPPDAFDAHAHLYPLATVGVDFPHEVKPARDTVVGMADYRQSTGAWMGNRCPRRGLFFGLPSSPRVDVRDANRHVVEEVAAHPESLCLLLVRPDDEPAAIEAEMRATSAIGFKVYHTFAKRRDTQNAELEEYLPQWVWELAHRGGLAIMLHLVRPRALADEQNQSALRANLQKWTGANLILAHAARGFCARHTVEGIEALVDFDNVFFDTSAICEADALLAVLRTFGARRLLFGTDFPVSAMRGRCVSVGDRFVWLTEENVRWPSSPDEQPTLVGIESLLALRQAARLGALGDAEVERIFRDNARELLLLLRGQHRSHRHRRAGTDRGER
jgi:glutamate-1-semialdehyde 2,1-aminomutase